MLIPAKYDFTMGKYQMIMFNIDSKKYPLIKIKKNRPAGMVKNLIIMMQNNESINNINNYLGEYNILNNNNLKNNINTNLNNNINNLNNNINNINTNINNINTNLNNLNININNL